MPSEMDLFKIIPSLDTKGTNKHKQRIIFHTPQKLAKYSPIKEINLDLKARP
jgi:hypothetical protein